MLRVDCDSISEFWRPQGAVSLSGGVKSEALDEQLSEQGHANGGDDTAVACAGSNGYEAICSILEIGLMTSRAMLRGWMTPVTVFSQEAGTGFG